MDQQTSTADDCGRVESEIGTVTLAGTPTEVIAMAPEPGESPDGVDFHPRTLEEIRAEHGLGEEWEPRFTANTPVAEQKADEYEQLGFEARVFPHPEDVGRKAMPGRGDRCVVYTRDASESDSEGGGPLDDDLF